MISIAVLCILLSAATPSVGYLIDRYDAHIAISTLTRTLRKSRSIALQQQVDVTVCPIKIDRCHNEWGSQITVFEDTDNNQTLDPGETVFFRTENNSTLGQWQKKRLNSPHMKFNPQGHAFSTATTFLYCPSSSRASHAKQLIINFQGRIRVNHYLSENGTPYASLAPLTCDPE